MPSTGEQPHNTLVSILAEWVVSDTGVSIEEELASLFKGEGWTLSVAESCTGGALGAALVARPGASEFFLGGVQSYANAAKVELLGVPAEMIEAHGAVSEPVARAMAEGARQRLGADYGVSITGIAGPDGGSEAKPVGTVFMACAGPDGTVCEHHRFGRDRARNQGMSVRAACRLALQEALSKKGNAKAAKGVADSL